MAESDSLLWADNWEAGIRKYCAATDAVDFKLHKKSDIIFKSAFITRSALKTPIHALAVMVTEKKTSNFFINKAESIFAEAATRFLILYGAESDYKIIRGIHCCLVQDTYLKYTGYNHHSMAAAEISVISRADLFEELGRQFSPVQKKTPTSEICINDPLNSILLLPPGAHIRVNFGDSMATMNYFTISASHLSVHNVVNAGIMFDDANAN